MNGDKSVIAVFVGDEGEKDDITLDLLTGQVANGTLNRGQGGALLASLSAIGRNL